MEEFIDMLNESLQPEITDFFGIQISTAIVTTWGIMAVLMILTLIFVRNLKVIPTSKSQIVVEMLVKFINDFFIGILGEEGKQYVPYLGTVLIYIVVANISGIFGVVPPILLPINILEVGIRPLSLCMRLFGNVLGADLVMLMIKFILPAAVPMLFSMYFDFFDGAIQAYVFVFLTSLFMAEKMESE